MLYGDSCEEHKYLAGIRKEKDSFQRLIKERGVSSFLLLWRVFLLDAGQSMLLPIYEDHIDARSDALIKTISTRIAGGRREVRKEPSQVRPDQLLVIILWISER
jgi:DNA excision repair protein ERCC-4